MGWLSRLLRRGTSGLDGRQRQRLEDWRGHEGSALDIPFREARYVVVDVETSGLDLVKDRLISIGAVAVSNCGIALRESFYTVLQQVDVSSKENIVLHGIGGAAQTSGTPAPEALLSFLEFLGNSPLVAFHVTFDQTMIRRAMREYLGFNFRHPWLDMAYVMPGLNPELAARHRSLDDWIGRFGIGNDNRHNALADALVTAQLFQVAVAQSAKLGVKNYSDLQALEKAQRWVSGVD